MKDSFHALERTSPKGEGQKFVGYCVKCGKTDLPMEAILWADECPNTRNMTKEEVLIEAILKE